MIHFSDLINEYSVTRALACEYRTRVRYDNDSGLSKEYLQEQADYWEERVRIAEWELYKVYQIELSEDVKNYGTLYGWI